MDQVSDPAREHTLDGNAAAALLLEFFGEEMTASPTTCNHCGREGDLGSLLVFAPTMGLVLRCPTCEGVVLRVVQTAKFLYLDARGAVSLRIPRRAG